MMTSTTQPCVRNIMANGLGKRETSIMFLLMLPRARSARAQKDCAGFRIAQVPNSSAEPIPIHSRCQLNDESNDCGRTAKQSISTVSKPDKLIKADTFCAA